MEENAVSIEEEVNSPQEDADAEGDTNFGEQNETEEENDSYIETEDEEENDASTADGGEDDEPNGEEQPKQTETKKETESGKLPDGFDYNETAAKERAKDDALLRHIDKVLKSYGFDEGSIEERLEKAAAESEGKTVEEFRKEEETRRIADENARIVQQLNSQRVFAADLAAIKAQYPDMDIKDIRDIPNFEIFAQARMAKLDAVRAFAAANPNYGREAAARSAKQNNLNGTKDHLRSSKPSANSDQNAIPAQDWKALRETFPEATDKHLRELYKRIKNK